MFERRIIRILKEGWTLWVRESWRIDRAFIDLGLTEAEAREARIAVVAAPPSIIFQYPRQDSTFPLVAVRLAEEEESQQFLNHFGSIVTSQRTLGPSKIQPNAVVRSSFFTKTYALWICAKHPDVALYLYEITKAILFMYRNELQELGMLTSQFSGSDMEPSEDYAPFWLFIRELRFQIQIETAIYDTPADVITQVKGVHVLATGQDTTPGTLYNVTASVSELPDE